MRFQRNFLLTIIFLLVLSFQTLGYDIVKLGPSYFPESTRNRPVANGEIYVGIPDLDPEVIANQQQLYVQEEDGDIIAVAQPIYTSAGGVPVYSGSPVTLLVNNDYSLKILNSSGVQVYYIPLIKSSENLGNAYTPDYNAVDQGLIGNNNTIKYFVDLIGTTDKATIFLKHNSGNAQTPYTVTTAETIPANITIEFEPGAYIDGTIAFAGSPDSQIKALPDQQIFSPTSTITFGIGGTTYSEWWITNATPGTTDMAIAINKAITSIPKGIVKLGSTIYGIGDTINMKSEVILQGDSINLTIPSKTSIVSNYYSTTIKLLNGSDCDMIEFGDGLTMSGLIGVGLDGNKTNQSVNTLYGIKIVDQSTTTMSSHRIEKVGIHYISGYGIYGGSDVRECNLIDVRILWNVREGMWLHNAIDWFLTRVSSGWNGNSALRLDGAAGIDSGSCRFFDTDFFGPDITFSDMPVLHDVFAETEAASAVVIKGNYSASKFISSQIGRGYRHGLYILEDTASGLVPGNIVFFDTVFDGASVETADTYDSINLTSGGASAINNIVFLACKILGVGGQKYGINDNNTTASIGNALIGCKFDSSDFSTSNYNSKVSANWDIDNTTRDVNPTSKIIGTNILEHTGITNSNYTALINDVFIRFIITSDQTLTLPNIATVRAGKYYIVYRYDTNNAVLTITGDATINAETNAYLATRGEALLIWSQGSVWEAVRLPYGSSTVIPSLDNTGTPSVRGMKICRTGGTTSITNFDDGYSGQEITIFAEHTVTITDGATIVLNGSANFTMNSTDMLTLINFGGVWYEKSRSDNT